MSFALRAGRRREDCGKIEYSVVCLKTTWKNKEPSLTPHPPLHHHSDLKKTGIGRGPGRMKHVVALSHKLRWSGVLALLMMGLVSGCFSDEEEAAPTEETDSSESAEAQENADVENTAVVGEGGEEGGEPGVDEPDAGAEPEGQAEPDVEEPMEKNRSKLSLTERISMGVKRLLVEPLMV